MFVGIEPLDTLSRWFQEVVVHCAVQVAEIASGGMYDAVELLDGLVMVLYFTAHPLNREEALVGIGIFT